MSARDSVPVGSGSSRTCRFVSFVRGLPLPSESPEVGNLLDYHHCLGLPVVVVTVTTELGERFSRDTRSVVSSVDDNSGSEMSPPLTPSLSNVPKRI